MPKSQLTERPVRMPEINSNTTIRTIEAYGEQIGTINMETSKASRFAMLLDDLFGGGSMDRSMLAEYLRGSEKNIKAAVGNNSMIIRGRPDALFGNAIIEFKEELTGSRPEDANDQLRRYALILHSNGDKADYIGIATDGQLFVAYSTLVENGETQLTEIERIDIRSAQPMNFFYWLDRYFLRKKPLKATSEYFVKDFGPDSHALHLIERRLTEAFKSFQNDSQVKTLYDEWDKYVRVAYGSKVYGPDLFVRHTYLASLAKLLAWIRVEGKDIIADEAPTLKIFDGSYFHERGIINFLEQDFFSWIALDIPQIKETREFLSKRFLNTLARYHIHGLSEDVMKALYQGLVDPKQRHDLGEYYTPDWLADLMTEHALKENPEARTLDPTCGSGTFLYSVIRYKIKRLGKKKDVLKHILNNVVGIDIHPLAIIIAKTNYILGLGDLLQQYRTGDVHIPIYLANSIAPPKEIIHAELFSEVDCYRIYIENRKGLGIPQRFVDQDRDLFDPAIDKVAEYAKRRAGLGKDEKVFNNLIAQVKGISLDERKPLFRLAETLRELIDERKDSIWAFIVKNSHRPVMMQAQFDLMIGNPPWLTFKDLETADYQQRVKAFIGLHQLETRAQNITHLELAALFWVRGSKLYLKPDGKIAFVMPRSVFSAQHHDKLRKGSFLESSVRFCEVWDMNSASAGPVTNLFKVPSCVLFGSMDPTTSIAQQYPILAKTFSGRLSDHNARLLNEDDNIVHTSAGEVTVADSKINLKQTKPSSAWDEEATVSTRTSHYHDKFFQGATLLPRTLWFVQPEVSNYGVTISRPIVHTDPRASSEGKPPYKTLRIDGAIESEYLFGTLIGTDLLPFGHLPIRPVIIPAIPENNHLKIIDSKFAESMAQSGASEWFRKAEILWDSNKNADKNKLSVYQRLDYMRGVSQQNFRSKYKVLYSTSGRLCAAVKKPEELIMSAGSSEIPLKGFIVDHKLYFFETSNLGEAEYLSAIFNSDVLQKLVEPFMTRGFEGAVRDVHRKHLEFPIPTFDPENEEHKQLAKLAREAEKKSKKFQETVPPPVPITPRNIGHYRNKVREAIAEELKEIDGIVGRLLGA